MKPFKFLFCLIFHIDCTQYKAIIAIDPSMVLQKMFKEDSALFMEVAKFLKG
jgi:hypothetical protein